MFSYTVVGYDKDNDVYVEYDEVFNLNDAASIAQKLIDFVKNGELRREETGEPIDSIEIYKNWGEENEERIWYPDMTTEVKSVLTPKKDLQFEQNNLENEEEMDYE